MLTTDMSYEEAVRYDRTLGQASIGPSALWMQYVDAGRLPPREPADRPPLVVFDIDGTAANVAHRSHYVRGPVKDWRAFNAAMHLDTVNHPVWLAYIAHRATSRVAFVSGREAAFRSVTEQWLAASRYYGYLLLLLRPTADYRPDHEVKRELYERYLAPYFTVELVYDDRSSVVALWRSLGIPCFQVAPGNF